jgi:MIP family channel proteins
LPLEYAVTLDRDPGMETNLRGLLAELIGTYVLVLFGAGAVCSLYLVETPRQDAWPSSVALAEGFALAVLLTATFHVSGGCLNPALTLTLWVFKKLEGRRALALVAAQLLGAALAGLTVRLLFQDDVLKIAYLGTPHLTEALRPRGDQGMTAAALLTGAALEALFTALLTFAVFGTLFDRRGPQLGGLGAGMAQAAIVAFGFWLTGGCANPARWFGTAVWEPTLPDLWGKRPLTDHAVYWAGPIVGALLGGYLYSTFILPPERTAGGQAEAAASARRTAPTAARASGK